MMKQPKANGDKPQPDDSPEATMDEGSVPIPEEFQKKVEGIVSNAPQHHLDHIRSRISNRESKLREGKSKEFNMEGLPS